ncbi:bile acid:sodium symporter [Micrococcus endophyticus]|uniref:bile acid:sodium symporter n=1 Tax=Micrococcus endophyticus TaxID=455343 RepID=UPI0034CF964E
MFELLQSVIPALIMVFVLTAMLNVGMTQDPGKILAHLSDWRYLARMVVANFFVVPGVMILFLAIFDVPTPYAFALVIFSMAAGAPLLLKLTSASDNDISAGATVQMVLMVATVLILPWLLPLVIDGVEVSAWEVAQSLLLQMLLPLGVGLVLFRVAEGFVAKVQPWVAKVSNVALYALLAATLIGYLPEMADGRLWKAIGVGLLVLLVAFYVGYGTGHGDTERSQIGGLGTGQRNTAAAMLVAQSNADDPMVFVTATLLNTLGMVMLLAVAKRLAGDDASLALLDPVASDRPGASDRD